MAGTYLSGSAGKPSQSAWLGRCSCHDSFRLFLFSCFGLMLNLSDLLHTLILIQPVSLMYLFKSTGIVLNSYF